MATYFLRAKHVSRGKGARVTRAAAYRAGERIRDERTSEVYDYSDRRDVAYKEVILPAEFSARPDMAWTQDRSTLWNAAEHAGLRRNSRLAREWLVLIPPELSPAAPVRPRRPSVLTSPPTAGPAAVRTASPPAAVAPTPQTKPRRALQKKAAVFRAQMSPRAPAAESSTSQGVAARVQDTEAASVQSSPGAAE
jgi:hypothetical protein